MLHGVVDVAYKRRSNQGWWNEKSGGEGEAEEKRKEEGEKKKKKKKKRRTTARTMEKKREGEGLFPGGSKLRLLLSLSLFRRFVFTTARPVCIRR